MDFNTSQIFLCSERDYMYVLMWTRISYPKTNVPTQSWLWGCLSVPILFHKAMLSVAKDKGPEKEELLHTDSLG